MNKIKYFSVLFFALAILVGCKKRDTFANNSFFDKTFNWTISIPDDYEKVNHDEKGNIKGDSTLVKKTHSIVAFKRDAANYFSANYEDYSGDIRSVDLKMKLKDFLLLKDIGRIYPKGKMGDYVVGAESISGLEFRKSQITVTEEGKTVATILIFSRTFNDKIFVASIVYENEDYGKAMTDLFVQSTFKK
ncbi:hypothetical protein [Flavobacterium sp. JAS]|jgi:hypothetical protein|uniref:hypothetical protein n=1 Tax=Flavobacterium sp. JAS TaxID=2897329 RepID=UPI001E62DCB2|nr:hypothetical protein [Flavobacterium sp. JAS]MCD0469343.1 hypothetical protein [Flavobacterium sp. JAS]